jgi:outer membrane murein-binding lipoprotein Lpp
MMTAEEQRTETDLAEAVRELAREVAELRQDLTELRAGVRAGARAALGLSPGK